MARGLDARALVAGVPSDRAAVGLSVAVGGSGLAPDACATGQADVRTHRPLLPGTLLHACSMSKLVAAVTVLRLVELGTLDLDTDASRYLDVPLLRADDAHDRPVTLAHLLSHQAGLVDPDAAGEPVVAGASPDLTALLNEGVVPGAGPVAVTRPPGQEFVYSDVGYWLVEHAVTRATGRPYPDVVDDLVLAPLGLTGPTPVPAAESAPLAGTHAPTAWAYVDAGTGGRLDRVVDSGAAVGHGTDGTALDDERAVYRGLAAAGLWATPTALLRLLVDLVDSWHGSSDGVLTPASARTLWSAPGPTRHAALGAFLLRHGTETVVQTHGWGAGFQGIARAHLDRRSAVVAMMCSDPGTDQDGSAVGAVADACTEAPGSS
ncbi:serine hydrolase domain-containing protein [Cellulomonas persica]|uniref:Penicillin-binding protein n=1 Tax=Cellulomonas persica TaxID=76861 RepID=A0A510V0E9_9CELL|nr:penicillin-binding protein [Cellulomonas persica]